MRSSFLLAGLLSLAGAAWAEVLESLPAVPEGWSELGAPDASTRLHFRIAVSQPNQELFEQTLFDVSTPGNARYGQHLSRDELKAVLKPRRESTDSILTWLRSSGVAQPDIHEDGEWINFIAAVAVAERMMETTFAVYRSDVNADVRKIRTLGYSVPDGLRAHVDMIQPTTRFGQIRPQSQYRYKEPLGPVGSIDTGATHVDALNITACNQTITPTCLRELYSIRGYEADPTLGFLGVNGFLAQYARYADLKDFIAEYAPGQNDGFAFQSVDGGQLPQQSTKDSVEANLDIQYTVSISDPVPNTFYSTPGRGPLIPDLDQPSLDDNQNEPYLDFFTWLVGQEDGSLPATLTTSYGEDEQSVPERYARKVCDLIGQLGTRGVSVIFSSGDTGVGSACQTNDGKNTTRFLPVFPAACPYVTSVGGTYQVEPERAIAFSSGGFSDRWPRPSYQDKAVPRYLRILGDQWKGLYNPEGRGFPDVAGQSANYHVVDQGREILVGGTSASAPMFAGIIALINNALEAQGKARLGFLNPWLYQDGYKALTDIVDGGSKGCTGKDIYSGLPTPFVPGASWNATKGWDPVTGYGTPDFQKMLHSAMKAAPYKA